MPRHVNQGMHVRIVAVDDDPVFLRLLQKAFDTAAPDAVILSAQGLQSGRRVLQQLNQLGLLPNAIVVDNSLGDGSGLQLLQHLSNDADFAGIPMVLISALMDDADMAAARAAGAAACFQKPAGFDPLVELVMSVIQLAGGSKETSI